MASLGTGFGARALVAGYRTEGGDVIAAQFRLPDADTAVDQANSPPAGAPAVPLSELTYLDLDQAANYCCLSRGTISNAIWAGTIIKELGSRKVVIRRENLDKFLATKRTKKKPRNRPGPADRILCDSPVVK